MFMLRRRGKAPATARLATGVQPGNRATVLKPAPRQLRHHSHPLELPKSTVPIDLPNVLQKGPRDCAPHHNKWQDLSFSREIEEYDAQIA
jgi:hypothetical protein